MPPKKNERPGNALVAGLHKQRMSKDKKNSHYDPVTTTTTTTGDLSTTEKSVTQLNDLELLMEEANLADREFDVERDTKLIYQDERSFKIINTAPKQQPTEEELLQFQNLTMPRRPKWIAGETTPEELEKMEKDVFLEWRRSLASLETSAEKFGLLPTPFEKNLHFWRQLWRVVERSDVIVQVVDARDPLMFRFPDLETFVKECGKEKRCVLLINKSDYLTENERIQWLQYFDFLNNSKINNNNKLEVIFFSALQAQHELDHPSLVGITTTTTTFSLNNHEPSTTLSSRQQVLDRLCQLAREVAQSIPGRHHNDQGVVGMVGYPNVGKSSVINALLGHSIRDHLATRVSVSATPGHTKHFQTLNIGPNDTTLCDCPGLVFPSFVSTKAEMICNGILPIDEIRGREFIPAIELLIQRVSRQDIEKTYNITLNLLPSITKATSETLLEAFCEARGLHGTGHGRYDEARGARVLLKDFVSGKLLWCNKPPNILYREHSHQLPSTKNNTDEDSQGEDDEEDDDNEQSDELAITTATATNNNNNDTVENDVVLFETTQKQAEDDAVLNKSRRLMRHGRKHKKARDKTPYEREGLTNMGANIAGKNGKSGFVRKEGLVG
jgi:large subunit GTPase 1